ncbi:hypothetical protein cypCar_00044849, partial [Cyprinus carpio]
ISSSYEQLSALVEGSSDDAPSKDIRIQQNEVDADGSVFAAKVRLRRALQNDRVCCSCHCDITLLFQPYAWQLHAPPRRKLLQSPGMLLYSPLSVSYNGKTCILFRARKLAIRYRNHSLVDLTERTFSPDASVDTKGSFCSKDKAILNLRFGDVEDLRGLSIRLQMSNTFYESAGQNWFNLDNVYIHYNWTHEAAFNATDVYAPSTNSYHCQHVSSLQKYDTLLVPSANTDHAASWHITFTDFQVGRQLFPSILR